MTGKIYCSSVEMVQKTIEDIKTSMVRVKEIHSSIKVLKVNESEVHLEHRGWQDVMSNSKWESFVTYINGLTTSIDKDLNELESSLDTLDVCDGMIEINSCDTILNSLTVMITKTDKCFKALQKLMKD